VLFASVEVGEDSLGFILNISEGGLCVQTAQEVAEGRPLQLRFQSLQSQGWVEAQGKIVWKNDAKTLAGIEFLDLSPEARKEVQTWLSFGDSLQDLRENFAEGEQSRREAPEETDARAVDAAVELESAAIAEANSRSFREHEFKAALEAASEDLPADAHSAVPVFREAPPDSATARRISPAAAMAVFFCAIALALLAYRHGNFGGYVRNWLRQKTTAQLPAPSGVNPSEAAAERPQTSSFAGATRSLPTHPDAPSAARQMPTAKPASSTASQVSTSTTFALQVAAMREEENANHLAESLRSKKFPVAVSKRPGEKLYKVFVGPYFDLTAVRSAQSALAKDGIPSLIRHATP
jgi:cell division septation protein DedD